MRREPAKKKCPCGEVNPAKFNPSRFYMCRDCEQEYRHAYILPALRGRGAARALPSWVETLMHGRALNPPHNVITLKQYVRPDKTVTTGPVVKTMGFARKVSRG
jgi:hypothetical protein